MRLLKIATGLAVVVLVTGCSGGTSSSARGKADDDKSSGIGIPVPSEALIKPPHVHKYPSYQLRIFLGGSLGALKSMHVEQVATTSAGSERASFDVDGIERRCSGEIQGSVHRQFVTTSDGDILVRDIAGGDPRWMRLADTGVAKICAYGPGAVVTGVPNYVTATDPGWPLVKAKRLGVAQVAGRRTVHFRQHLDVGAKGGGSTADFWLIGHGRHVRIVKMVMTHKNGDVTTTSFSEFDRARPVAPEPPADQIVGNGSV